VREYLDSFVVVLLHHGGDSIDENLELFDDFLIDVEVLRSLEGVECFIVVSILNLYLGDFVDCSCYCPLVSVEFNRLLVADYRIVGPL
jgi:hypothetical protein